MKFELYLDTGLLVVMLIGVAHTLEQSRIKWWLLTPDEAEVAGDVEIMRPVRHANWPNMSPSKNWRNEKAQASLVSNKKNNNKIGSRKLVSANACVNDTSLQKPRNIQPLSQQEISQVNEQTLRIIQIYVSNLLKRRTPIKTDMLEFQFLEFSKKIFLKFCPTIGENNALKYSIFSLFNMFRSIVLDNAQLYPHDEDSDTSRILTIIEGLKLCLIKAKPLNILYRKCGDLQVESATKALDNGTIINLNSSIHSELAFDISLYDAVVETPWKMFIFTAYHCMDFFESRPFLHSTFIFQTEKFWDVQKVINRWIHPLGQNQVYKSVLYAYNLERLAKQVDECVGSSMSGSIYPRIIYRKLKLA